jgi:NadR type nicotinamide-nucleotide adenylyltransferase
MNATFRRGLVVGKFAPLHRGHVHLIDTAAAACVELVLIGYCVPEFPGFNAAQRERWLRTLFPSATVLVPTDDNLVQLLPAHPEFTHVPSNDAPADTHRRFCAALVRDLPGSTVEAVFTSEDYGDAFASTLTREFRRTNQAVSGVVHVCVDRARAVVPTAASTIRKDVHAHRTFLPREVYADFVERACLLGAESTGKSTLAETLAREFNTTHVAEFGRELWIERGGRLRFEDYRTIVEAQVAREESALRDPRTRRYLFCDTSPLTTLFYQLDQFGRADPFVESVAASRNYHQTFLCAADFPLVQDGTRQDEAFRRRQHAWFVSELSRRHAAHQTLTGDSAVRLARAIAHLKGA